MGYDVVLQRFCAGEAAEADNSDGVWRLLRGAWKAPPDVHGYCRVSHAGGEADLYGAQEGEAIQGLMFSRLGGGVGVFELMVRVARAGDMVILPLDVPPCVVRAAQLAELPPELRGQIPSPVLVSSGAELHSLVTGP
jgi:hypothetical protein